MKHTLVTVYCEHIHQAQCKVYKVRLENQKNDFTSVNIGIILNFLNCTGVKMAVL